MVDIKKPVRDKPVPLEQSFALKLPDEYILALDGLVLKGAAESRNDLIVQIIGSFLKELANKPEGDEYA
jgi:hypothetical protein